MDQKQADAIAKALMAEELSTRAAADKKRFAAQERLALQRCAAGFGLAGMALGALAGYFAFGQWFPSGLVGFGIGAVAGRWLMGRQA